MSELLLQHLCTALDLIDRPGSFCVQGSLPAILPGLEVADLGPVGLPLTAGQAKELAKQCEQAPYGKGEETLVDTSVRRVWRLMPDRFSLDSPDWQPFVEQIVGKVQQGLGLEKQKLEAHLYDLLLYEKGSFFLPHRDGEKLDRMVATLVLTLPCSFEGGELVVRHEGQEQVIDFQSANRPTYHIHYAAFYADCEHEVRPLRAGYRLSLVYNLTLARAKKSLGAPRASEHVERITPILRDWAAAEDAAQKLVVLLDHKYTQEGLAWDALKGVDRARADVLAAAAHQAGCHAYLALVTLWESGSASGWYDEVEDSGDYEMEEVFDSSLIASQLSDSEGQKLPVGELYVEEDELLDPEAMREGGELEEDFEGYTGNAGMTLERWYRHVAILLWPASRHFQVLSDVDGRAVVPLLERMVDQWRQSRGTAADELKKQCLELAVAILARWPKWEYFSESGENARGREMLALLAALEEPELIGTFLGEILLKDVSINPGPPLAAVCRKYGWGTFRPQLTAVCQATTEGSLQRNVRLLEEVCLARAEKQDGWTDLCTALAQELVAALERLDGEIKVSYGGDWVRGGEVLAGLARVLIRTGQDELFLRVVKHALALPKKYPLDEAHLPALEQLGSWLKKNLDRPSPALGHWVTACREQLEARTAESPQEPADFRRDAPIRCKCADCTELKRFLQDPSEPVHRFTMPQDRRSHLEEQIRHSGCDLDMKTERTRPAHTLVCTKNKASYQKKLKKFQEDQKHLDMVVALQGSLPG